MHLLNTRTKQLESVGQYDKPRYAILSHRWETEEVSFRAIQSPKAHKLKGYTKIVNCCSTAARDGFQYVWIDACCINNESSAELSEAINSMFRWYRDAARCYVYLYDAKTFEEFAKSSWFRRGWTLQELLAPSELQFFNKDWEFMFSKQDVLRELEFITSIPQAALKEFHSQDYYVANKMSWFMNRSTTREEDQAYCLLGIFDVTMPMIYGEGSRAFERLQEQIMENSIDMSLFAWQGTPSKTFGMLASSPACFTVEHKHYNLWTGKGRFDLPTGWTKNNAGITMELELSPHLIQKGLNSVFLAKLHEPGLRVGYEIGVFLEDLGKDRFRRVTVDGQAVSISSEAFYRSANRVKHLNRKVMIVRKPINHTISSGYHEFEVEEMHDFHVKRYARPSTASQTCCSYWPITSKFVYPRTDAYGILGYLSVNYAADINFQIFFGYDINLRPICLTTIRCSNEIADLPQRSIIDAHSQLLVEETGEEAFDGDSGTYALRCLDRAAVFVLYSGQVQLKLEPDLVRLIIQKDGLRRTFSQYEADISVAKRREIFSSGSITAKFASTLELFRAYRMRSVGAVPRIDSK